MPSPIAHSITGYVIFKEFLARDRAIQKGLSQKMLLVWTVFTANVADLDFIPHFFFGVNAHRGFTHSVVFSFCFCFLVTTIAHALLGLSWRKLFLLTEIIYASHLLLDFFTAGGNGMPLLWPFSEEVMKSAVSLFPGVHHSEGLFHWGHIVFITYESLYAILLVKISHTLSVRKFWKDSNNC